MKYKYSAYCTCFYVPEEHQIWIFDEINNRKIQTISVDSRTEAKEIMENWKDTSPADCICGIL